MAWRSNHIHIKQGDVIIKPKLQPLFIQTAIGVRACTNNDISYKTMDVIKVNLLANADIQFKEASQHHKGGNSVSMNT